MNRKSTRQRQYEVSERIRQKEAKRLERKAKREAKREAKLNPPNDPIGYEGLIPQKIENKEIEMDLRDSMKDGVIPKPLNSIVWVGTTGSGKTNTFLWMLMNENMYKDYFDEVYLFSMSAKLDPLFNMAGIPEKNIISDRILAKTGELMDAQKTHVEQKGFKKAKALMFIFEDSTGNNKLLKSPELVYAFTMGRHMKITIVLMCHKYKSLLPTIRLNASQLCIFPCNNSQQYQLWEDYGPTGCSKKCFFQLMSHAFEATDEDKRPFFLVDNKNKYNKMHFRKGWYECLIPNKICNDVA